MNGAHIHLLFNHIPIIGVLMGLLVLIGGFVFNNNVVKRTAAAIFIVSALGGVPAFFSGEDAEEIIENMPGISHDIIEDHEKMGAIFFYVLCALGLLSAAALYLDIKKNPVSKYLFMGMLALAIGDMALGKMAGTSGGEIRHTEIRSGYTAPAGEREHGDDD